MERQVSGPQAERRAPDPQVERQAGRRAPDPQAERRALDPQAEQQVSGPQAERRHRDTRHDSGSESTGMTAGTGSELDGLAGQRASGHQASGHLARQRHRVIWQGSGLRVNWHDRGH
ncbi:unnamed protein product, partial [Staurois parvus]